MFRANTGQAGRALWPVIRSVLLIVWSVEGDKSADLAPNIIGRANVAFAVDLLIAEPFSLKLIL